MTTPTESIRNAIVAELDRQKTTGPVVGYTHDLDRQHIRVSGYIDLDALAAAVAEHVA